MDIKTTEHLNQYYIFCYTIYTTKLSVDTTHILNLLAKCFDNKVSSSGQTYRKTNVARQSRHFIIISSRHILKRFKMELFTLYNYSNLLFLLANLLRYVVLCRNVCALVFHVDLLQNVYLHCRAGVPNRCVARDHEVCREIIKKIRIKKIKIKLLVEILYTVIPRYKSFRYT
jgi:hypothetical protein